MDRSFSGTELSTSRWGGERWGERDEGCGHVSLSISKGMETPHHSPASLRQRLCSTMGGHRQQDADLRGCPGGLAQLAQKVGWPRQNSGQNVSPMDNAFQDQLPSQVHNLEISLGCLCVH